MPWLPYSVELHDSVLAAIERVERDYIFRLRPAYVHREGKGWTQDIDLILLNANVVDHFPAFPARIADGSLRTSNGPYHNLLTMPLTELGAVALKLEFFDESRLDVLSDGIHVVVQGPLVFVETLA